MSYDPLRGARGQIKIRSVPLDQQTRRKELTPSDLNIVEAQVPQGFARSVASFRISLTLVV